MLQKETLNFLKNLKDNNDRIWFETNKSEYEKAKQDVLLFVENLIPKMALIDPELKGLEAKKCLMRIYRDVRFSKDKLPYKTNFGIWLSGKSKTPYPGYYLHLQPGNSFVAGGYWMPSPEHLKSIRQEIDYNLDEFNTILTEKSFKSNFKELSTEEKLKTAPKDYPKDHLGIELLKLKSYTVSMMIDDKDLFSGKAADQIIATWKSMLPLTRFLQRAIG